MSSRVIVVGGGLIGCSIAWRLVTRGAHVHVIESGRPGMAASWAAAGMLTPMVDTESAALNVLAAASSKLFPSFVNALHEATGIDAELQLSGKIDVAFSDGEIENLRARYGAPTSNGVRELSLADARTAEPELAAEVVGAVLSQDDGSVDNRKLARAAWVAATTAGAEFTTGASVRGIVCGRDRFEAVVLSTGERIAADAVVICAGAWSSALRGLPQPLPVFPVRGQMLALERLPRVLSHIVMSEDCYIVPRTDGRVLIGATVERAGYDPRTTAAGVAQLMNAGLRAVPALGGATFLEAWAGLRPATPDDLPILGGDPRAPGVFYATGHFRNGILLAPITADIMANVVLSESPRVEIAPFSVMRFHG